MTSKEFSKDEMQELHTMLGTALNTLNFYRISPENGRTAKRTAHLRKIYDALSIICDEEKER